jgi:naringenin degradation protein FdeH
MNRVVTGFDPAGQPVVLHRGEPPTVIHAGRYVTTELWVTDRTPPVAASSDASTRDWDLEPPAGGSCFRIVEIAPADATADPGAADPGAADPGAADSGAADAEHDGFQEAHATETLDYVTVISGEVVLVVGDHEITLGPGDSVVQQPGVPHDWQNRSAQRAVMVGVLLSAR